MEAGYDRTRERELQRKRRLVLSTALAFLLACAVLLPLLGHRPLTDWDEGIYAEIAREMLAAHTLRAWLIPHWNGHLWFEKPPLAMWLTACCLRLLGPHALAARLPSALAGIATVVSLHAWLQCRLGTLTAFLGTVILLSGFGFQHAARVGETDTLLSLFCLVAVLGLAELLRNNAGGWLLFFTGFALALMTKGAASITLPVTAMVVVAMHPRRLLRHRQTLAIGTLLFVAVALPWHIFLVGRFGRAFLRDYVGLHAIARASGAIEDHHTHPWFYVWVLLVSAPLFSLFYPLAIAAPFRTDTDTASRSRPVPLAGGGAMAEKALGFCAPCEGTVAAVPVLYMQAFAVFAMVTLTLFSLAGTRLPHYIAPAYPPFAALTASLLVRWIHFRLRHDPRSVLVFASAALVLYTATALVTARFRKALHDPHLRGGYTTPDNRESIALLEEFRRLGIASPGGPLLVWRKSPVVPLTTDAFYAGRLAQQVTLSAPPADLPRDPYFNDPKPLEAALPAPRLALLDNALAAQLPPGVQMQPLVSGGSQTLAVVTPPRP